MGSTVRAQAGVIGAGIAGLCAATALRRAGWDVEIFERSQFKNEVGAAISVTPNATQILEHWNFDFEKARPVPNEQLRMRMAADLAPMVTEQFPNLKEQFGYTSWSFHRVDLHKGLRDLALDPDGPGQVARLRLGCEVKAVDFETGTIELPDGNSIQKDLVVIADGAHSHLIKQFTGRDDSVIATGRSVYRWLVPMDRVREDEVVWPLYDKELPGFLGVLQPNPNVFFISYACRGDTLMNCAVVHDTRRGEGEVDLWNSPASKEQVYESLRDFHPALKKLVDLEVDNDIKVHHLLKRPTLDTFVRGKTLVLGDAAHVMMPTHAAGGAVSIESAAAIEVLFRDLAESSPDASLMTDRLRLFDQLRLPRCNMTMIISNAGPAGLGVPGVEEAVRKYYSGTLPPVGSVPWTAPFRELMFRHDAFKAAENALREANTES